MTLALAAPLLLRRQGFVAGRRCDADSGETFEVRNPSTGSLIGDVPLMGAVEARRAIAAAEAAWPAWRSRTPKERGALLLRWRDLLLAHQEDLARLMTAEQGKPLAEARGEVAYGAAFFEWFAEEAKRVYGETIPSAQADRRLLVTR